MKRTITVNGHGTTEKYHFDTKVVARFIDRVAKEACDDGLKVCVKNGLAADCYRKDRDALYHVAWLFRHAKKEAHIRLALNQWDSLDTAVRDTLYCAMPEDGNPDDWMGCWMFHVLDELHAKGLLEDMTNSVVHECVAKEMDLISLGVEANIGRAPEVLF